MKRHRLALGLLLTTAIMVLMPCAQGHADEIGANKSALIRGLLATVVNISTREDEISSPKPADATASGTSGAADGGPNIKSYAGSGFVIDPTGLIITNYHVVEDAFEITVMLSDGSLLPGKMLGASRLADIAIVKVEPDHPLTAAHWGNSDALQVGDQVFAAGNPFGLGLSVSAGIVSALNRDIQDSPYDDFIQTDAAINHGNSGGPLFDMQGNVVGVNSTIISPSRGSSGVGFAIPSSSAHFVFDQLRAFGWVHPGWIGVKLQVVTRAIGAGLGMPHPEGSIVDQWDLRDAPTPVAQPKLPMPPNLGLSFAALDAEARAKLKLGTDAGGVLIKNVAQYSDAANRGLTSGDVILRVQDRPVTTADDVISGINAARSDKRDFVLMLILPKTREIPGPEWIALRVATATD